MTPEQRQRLPRYAQEYIDMLERSFDGPGVIAYVVLGFSFALILFSVIEGFALGQLLSAITALLALLVVSRG